MRIRGGRVVVSLVLGFAGSAVRTEKVRGRVYVCLTDRMQVFPIGPNVETGTGRGNPADPEVVEGALLATDDVCYAVFTDDIVARSGVLILLLVNALGVVITPVFVLSRDFSRGPVSSPLRAISSTVSSV